jgi:hypothetical protein
VNDLVDAFRRARTSADHNRARLALQRFGTPLEVRTVARELADLPREVHDWVVRLDEYCSWERPELASFTRDHDETDSEDWVLYRTEDAVTAPQLLIGFAGAVGNLFQPAPVVLQHLPRGAYDLLLLNDPHRDGYLRGVAGTADLGELTTRLAQVAADHPDVVTYGTSSGGHPALHVGAALGARRALSIGGRPRDDLPALPTRTQGQRPTDLVCIHGAQNVGDTAAADVLVRRSPGAVAISVDAVSAHNVQHAAFQGGRLTALFEALLGTGPLPVRAEEAGEAPGPERSLLVLDLPPHRPDMAPPWARAAETPSSLPLRRTGILSASRRKGAWSMNTRLRWRVAKHLARRVRLSADRAARLEGFIYRRAGVVLRFRRR